ncbi:MAG TPA: maleylpyruvate isomerase N-terminal domain-containing protein [Acidimicrobiales bacterium]|jgi:uncharacterized protein (TIGR03083 family)|nr:maleylpyruvate isomerase N-terminal domain-containing protein [Acidimicrobiales bacterium]
MDNPLPPLTASVDRLRALVEGYDVEQLERPSYSRDWTIADVLSHLGSGAVLMARRLEAAVAGAPLPDDIAQPVWDEWNAKSPRAKADDALVEDERLERAFGAVGEADRARIAFPFGPMSVSFDTAAALRLNEHALHTWDIEVMSDAAARLPADAADVIVDNLGLIGRFAAKATGDEREIRVRTAHPVRHFTVRLTPDSAELLDGDGGIPPDLELPAEAFCRLVYGRLDPDHSPPVRANGELLATLRRVFPGL